MSFDSELTAFLRSQQPAPPRRHQTEDKTPMHLATVARWNHQRGYGFLTADAHLDGIPKDREVFAHKSSLPRGVDYLTPGQRGSGKN
jgi:cold shock CspA family protein